MRALARLRRSKLTAAIGWLIIVSCCWWRLAPARPIAQIPLGKANFFVGTTSAGQIVTCQTSSYDPDRWETRGPVQFWNTQTGRPEFALLDHDDVILTLPDEADAVAVRRGDTISVVDFKTGDVRFSRQVAAQRPQVVFSGDGEQVAIVDDLSLTLCSAKTGDVVWSKEFLQLAAIAGVKEFEGPLAGTIFVQGQFQVLIPITVNSGGAYCSIWLESATGNPRANLPLESAQCSLDGRRILVPNVGDEPGRLYDAVTGQLVRRFAGGELPHVFSRDSRELIAYRPDGLTRWSVEDGRRLDDSLNLSSVPGVTNLDGSRVVTQGFHLDSSDWRRWMGKIFGRYFEELLPSQHKQAQVVDVRSGRQRMAKRVRDFFFFNGNYVRFDLISISGGSRFGIVTWEEVAIYDFSLAPDWAWLLKWGLGPIAVVAGFVGCAAMNHRRMKAHRDTMPAALTSPPSQAALPSASS